MPLMTTGDTAPKAIGLEDADEPRIRTKHVPGDPSTCIVSRVLPGYKALRPELIGWVGLRNERYRPMALGQNGVRMNPTHEYRYMHSALAHLITGLPRPDAIDLDGAPSGHRNVASTQKPPASLRDNPWSMAS